MGVGGGEEADLMGKLGKPMQIQRGGRVGTHRHS